MTNDRLVIESQPRQKEFLRHTADVLIFGGGGGGGKTFALLLDPLRYINNPDFKAVIFRRTYPLILKPGGIWDDSKKIYSNIPGAEPLLNPPRWRFASGATITFQHLESDQAVYEFKSAQIPAILWDQVEEFSESQWWYLFSRNRTTCGVTPYVRATCNPDAESWLAGFLSWWVDQDTGYPIDERAGKTRWMARDGEKLVWGNTAADVQAKVGPECLPKSVSFIPALLDDNPALTKKDPGYRANLQMLTTVERERLLKGNWKIRPQAGIVFPRTAWKFCPTLPEGCVLARYFDKASTEGGSGARTAGVLIAVHGSGRDQRFFVVDVVAGRWADLEREQHIRTTAELDQAQYGHRVTQHIEEEGGSGGKSDANATVRNLAGFEIYPHRKRTSKYIAWRPFARQVQAGNVWIVTGQVTPTDRPAWDFADFIRELDALAGDPNQDGRKLKDCADAASGAFDWLTSVAAQRDRELLCSGAEGEDRYEARKPLSEEEIGELPDDIASVISDLRQGRRSGAYAFDDDRY